MTQADLCVLCEVSEYRFRYAPSNSILTKLSNLANTVKQHLQHPGCGSALAETGIGAVTTVGIGAAILAAGPEEAAAGFTAAVVSEAEEYGTGGAVLAISDIGHAVGTAAAAPLGVTAQGFSNAVSNCF